MAPQADTGTRRILVTAAHDLDTSWKSDALCRRVTAPAARRDSGWTIWMADYNDPLPADPDEMRPREQVEWALLFCQACPVQYECVHYAIDSLAKAGTYGVRLAALKWLQGYPQHHAERMAAGHALVEQARTRGLPVHQVVEPAYVEARREAREETGRAKLARAANA